MFGGLITSKMRVRILQRLFLDPRQESYLRELAEEFNASPSQVRDELHQLNRAGVLTSERRGRQIHYRANTEYALFPELHSMVKKALGMDRILDSIIERLGNLELAFVVDDYATGRDSGLIDLVLVGEIDQSNLADLVAKTERYIGRKIRPLALTRAEYQRLRAEFTRRPRIVLWGREEGESTVTSLHIAGR
jgi:DNA-binding transcriptional ArsR family regulator